MLGHNATDLRCKPLYLARDRLGCHWQQELPSLVVQTRQVHGEM